MHGILLFKAGEMGDKKLSDRFTDHSSSNGQAVPATAHDWESYKNIDKDFFDDGTTTFFWWTVIMYLYNVL